MKDFELNALKRIYDKYITKIDFDTFSGYFSPDFYKQYYYDLEDLERYADYLFDKYGIFCPYFFGEDEFEFLENIIIDEMINDNKEKTIDDDLISDEEYNDLILKRSSETIIRLNEQSLNDYPTLNKNTNIEKQLNFEWTISDTFKEFINHTGKTWHNDKFLSDDVEKILENLFFFTDKIKDNLSLYITTFDELSREQKDYDLNCKIIDIFDEAKNIGDFRYTPIINKVIEEVNYMHYFKRIDAQKSLKLKLMKVKRTQIQ